MIDVTNKDRAVWAFAAVAAFQTVCPTDDEDAIPDLICDLLHLARLRGEDPEAILGRAERNFQDEEYEETVEAREGVSK